jgi:hypothetical protein
MNLTEAYAEHLAECLDARITEAQESSRRLWRIIDPESQGPGSKIPYPPDAGWLNALEQSAATAVMETQALLGTLQVIRDELRHMAAEQP